MKYYDMDTICAHCGKRYGEHLCEDCPDGTKGGFAPQGFQVGNWYRCTTPLHMYGEGITKREVYKVVEVDQSDDTLKVEGISLWFHFTRFDPTPVPEPPCNGKIPGPIEPDPKHPAEQPDQQCPWVVGPSAYYIAQGTSPSRFIVEGAPYTILRLVQRKNGSYRGWLRRLTDGMKHHVFYNLQRYFIPEQLPHSNPTEQPDPNAWRSVCPYDPYGRAEHQRWLDEQACLDYHKEQNRDQPFIAAMAKIEDLLQAPTSTEHPIALGQPTEDEKPKSK